MSGAAYLGWDELDDVEEQPAPGQAAAGKHNERLSRLLTERARLERELNRALGREPPSEDEKRENARFPMPIHTAESRMEDRRIANEELRARLAMRRSLERAQLRLLVEQQRAERKRDQERSGIQRELIQVAEERRRRELLELIQHQQRVSESIQQRWVEQRRSALRAREQARRAEWTLFDEKSTYCNELAARLSEARRRDHTAVNARLDRRAERGRNKRRSEARN